MKKTNRKVDSVARQEISNILLFETSDKRLQNVTITSVSVSYDRAYADVFYTSPKNEYQCAANGLENAKGFIRSCMAKRLDWKKSPELRFHLDETIDNATTIEKRIATEKDHFNA